MGRDDETAEHPHGMLGVQVTKDASAWRVVQHPGPWMADAAGTIHGGALGVLADIAFSIPQLTAHLPELAPVTSSLALDFVPGADLTVGPLVATSELLAEFEHGGLARGLVRNGRDEVVASGSLVGILRAAASGYSPGARQFVLPANEGGLEQFFQARPEIGDECAQLELTVRPRFENARATFHGGVQFLLAEYVARALLQARDGRQWAPMSGRLDFLRVAPTGFTVRMRALPLRVGRGVAVVDVECHAQDILLTRGVLSYAPLDG